MHNNLKVSALPLQCHVAESYKINAISQTDIMQLNSAVKSFTKILIGAASYRYSTVMCVLKFMGFQFLFHFGLCNSNRHIVYGVSIPFGVSGCTTIKFEQRLQQFAVLSVNGVSIPLSFQIKVYGVSIPLSFQIVQQQPSHRLWGINSFCVSGCTTIKFEQSYFVYGHQFIWISQSPILKKRVHKLKLRCSFVWVNIVQHVFVCVLALCVWLLALPVMTQLACMYISACMHCAIGEYWRRTIGLVLERSSRLWFSSWLCV